MESIIQAGDSAKANGDNLMARVNYETAARIALYEQNKDEVIRCVTLAEQAQPRELHKTLLSKIDKVMTISHRYYHD
ncbi:MAG: hypothetical protein JRN15_06050 [Nitrososphaerota archaeon]|nr:hypothetical protein [Nitrososphaerota archaeon]